MDVHSPEKHVKHVCYHEDARKAYGETVAWGFQDVFVEALSDAATVHVLGLSGRRIIGGEQGVAHRSYLIDCAAGKQMC